MHLSKVSYKDDPWVLGNRVAQVFYELDQSIENKKGRKAKARSCLWETTIGVDGVLDPEDLTNSAKCLSLQPTREDN